MPLALSPQQHFANFGTGTTTAYYSHDVQDYNKEFTLEKPLLVIYMAGHLEDKHKCFFHGDELGIDNRLDSFMLPRQVNHLEEFPTDLDKDAVYGYAAACALAL